MATDRVAVLGATGSVGRQVCAAFSRCGNEVLAIARHPASHLAGIPFRALDVAGTDPEELAKLLRSHRIAVVVNAAGRWGPTEAEMIYSHLRLIERLVAAMALLSEPPRLVHLGSIHEYGPVPAGRLIDESIPPDPATSYARTKLAGSQTVLRATRAGRADGVVLRPVNMYGPYPPAETFLAGLIGRLRAAAAAGTTLELDIAEARRDFVDVRDVAAAVVRAARAPHVAGRVVNIGRGEAFDMRDLVSRFIVEGGFPLDLVKMARRPVPSQGGDWTRADIRLAGELLDWAPRIAPRDSLRAMWTVSG